MGEVRVWKGGGGGKRGKRATGLEEVFGKVFSFVSLRQVSVLKLGKDGGRGRREEVTSKEAHLDESVRREGQVGGYERRRVALFNLILSGEKGRDGCVDSFFQLGK